MTDVLVDKVLDFLRLNQIKGPFLLAYSGGIDSKALLYLLVEARKKLSFSLHIAHVDHALRESSSSEARVIELEAEELKIPFYTKTLKLQSTSNLEEKCRDLRHEFYKKVCYEHQIPTVLIAHQADDVAETTLKRVLEGANLTRLVGIQPVSARQGYQIARPLLGIWKEELIDWLKARGLSAFEDPTNYGEQNLRAKMRTKIFPDLEVSFGKQVKKSFTILSDRACELSDYLDEKVNIHLKKKRTGPWGDCFDCRGIHPFELKYLILKIFVDEEIKLSRQEVQLLSEWLVQGLADKRVERAAQKIWADRGFLFIQRRSFLKGDWKIHIEDTDLKQVQISDWRELWVGKASAIVPKGIYSCRVGALDETFKGHLLKKWWSEQKTPNFLRSIAPVIDLEGKAVGDFLSGQFEKLEKQSSLQKIHLRYEYKKD